MLVLNSLVVVPSPVLFVVYANDPLTLGQNSFVSRVSISVLLRNLKVM